jgi:NDP-sugar pyrophosphorylase family protein
MKDIQLIIPMSGIGKRFIDAGYKEPKSLIEIDGKPIIEHVVNLFTGVEDITFICNEVHKGIEDILKKIKPNCKIYWVSNENRKGPVDAVLQIKDYIDDNKETIISYCDYGTVWNFNKFLKETRFGNFDGVIPCYIGFHPHMLGSDNYAFCRHKDNILLEIKEKESFTGNKMDEYASNGTYYFKSGALVKKYFKELIDLGLNLNGEYYVSLVYNLLVRDKLRISIFEIEKMLQWGTPYDLEIYKSWLNYFNNIKIEQPKIAHANDVTLILPMAGKGSRFSAEGYDLPKPLIDVDGKPMIIQAVDCLPKTENKIFICLKEHVDKYNVDKVLKKYYQNTEILNIDGTTEGQACTCELGISQFKLDLEKPILISACDNGVYYDTEEYIKLVNDETIDIIVWSFRNNQASKVNPNMYAWLNVDENNFIKHVSCKKFIYDDPLKTHAIIGTMFFRKSKYFTDGLKKNYIENIRSNNEFYVDDVLNQNIKEGLKVKVFEVKNYICWGTPDDYKTYNYWKSYFLN